MQLLIEQPNFSFMHYINKVKAVPTLYNNQEVLHILKKEEQYWGKQVRSGRHEVSILIMSKASIPTLQSICVAVIAHEITLQHSNSNSNIISSSGSYAQRLMAAAPVVIELVMERVATDPVCGYHVLLELTNINPELLIPSSAWIDASRRSEKYTRKYYEVTSKPSSHLLIY